MTTAARQCFRLILGTIILVIITCGSLQQSHAGTHEPVTLDSVLSTWTERGARARSIDVSAEGTEFRREKKFTATALRMRGRDKEKESITAPDSSFEVGIRLAIDNDAGLFRMDYQGKDTVPVGGVLPEIHTVEISNANDGRRDTVFLVNNAGYPSGHIRKEEAPHGPRHPQALPLRVIYRPFDPKIGVFGPSKLTLTNIKGVVEDRACLILSGGEKTVWLDPRISHLISRQNQQ